MKPQDVRQARADLGDLWGLGRPLTVNELARVLRLRGERADDTIMGWERGKTEPSGPVTVALELMREPPDVRIDAAMAALCELPAEPHRENFGQFLSHHFGDEARALLEEIVLTVSDAVRRPIGAEAAVAVTQFHNRDRRHRGDTLPARRRHRRA